MLHIVAASGANPDGWRADAAFTNHLYSIYLELFAQPESLTTKSVAVPNPELAFEALQSCFTTIAAAGGLVLNTAQEYLWIHRMGKWDLPKGKLEEGETTAECAVREVAEECGLPVNELHIAQPLPNTYHTYFLKGQHVLKTTYWFEMLYVGHAQLVPQTEEDISAVQWFDETTVRQVALANTYQNILNLLQQVQFV